MLKLAHKPLLLSLVASVFVASLVAGQDATPRPPAVTPTNPDEPADLFIEAVEVNLVELEVYVTDRDGKPITDLKRNEFRVVEDKRPVDVTNFSVYVAGAETRREVDGVPVDLPPPTSAALGRLEDIPADQRVHLVIFVDNFNIRPFNRNRTFRRIREFVRTALRPGDRLMLASYERSFKERVPFTQDTTKVVNALYEMENETGFAQSLDAERDDILRELQETEDAQIALGRVRLHAENVFNDQSFTIDALKGFIAPLAGLPGRKVVVHVSDGIPMVADQDLFLAINEQFRESSAILESRTFDMSRKFMEVANLANASGVTFYMIDAGGLRAFGGSASTRFNADYGSRLDSSRTYNIQAPLQLVSEETGGFAIVNTNDVGLKLAEVERDLRTYYSIGYSPAGGGGSGRFRKVEVEVTRPGRFVVRHRQGYRDKTVQSRMRDGVLASLLWDTGSNPMGIDYEAGEAERREAGNYIVPFSVRIPIGALTLVPTESGKHIARVRLYIGAVDPEGGRSEISEVPIGIEVPEAELEVARAGWYRYELSLAMRGGFQRLSIGCRDEVGGTESYVVRTFQVGSRP